MKTMKDVEQSLKKLIGLFYSTDEMLKDADEVEDIMRKVFDDRLLKLIKNGNGEH